MSNTITLSEPNVNSLISAGWTGLRLERGPNATNLAAFTLVAQIPYVTGQTSYLYVDTSGTANDWYRTARYGPTGQLGSYTPAWPVAAPPTTVAPPARRSLRSCRRMLGRRMQGSLHVITTTADGTAAGTTLVSQSGLANQVDANRYRQWWVMPIDGVSAGQVRHVGEQGLNPTTGELGVAPAYTSQIVRGTQVELSRLLPPEEMDGFLGLRQCLNLALAECWAIDRVQLSGVDNQVTYDLAYGDWLDPQAIHEFYGPVQGVGNISPPWGGWAARRDGSQVLLDTAAGIAGGSVMDVSLTRPGDTMIRRGGVWLDGQQGFELDDDECLFQPEFLVQVALAHAYEALAGVTTGANAARLQVRADTQRIIANKAKYSGLPHPPERSDHSLGSYSPDAWWTWIK